MDFRKIREKLSTDVLGHLYRVYFLVDANLREKSSRLERVLQALAQRTFDERARELKLIREYWTSFVEANDSRIASIYQEMHNYFVKSVM
jgi:hypothetical protein